MTAKAITVGSMDQAIRRAVLIALSLCLVGCGKSGSRVLPVSRAEMGKRWPLTVDQGTVSCDGSAVLFEANGVTYAVNGTALTRHKWKDIEEIWAPGEPMWVTDPVTKKLVNAGPRKKDLAPIASIGSDLCTH